jgi:menaquinone-dependent protoporphyrinogen IX oxidase
MDGSRAFIGAVAGSEVTMAQMLVVHASRHGSTTEVAVRIAEHLRQAGHQVDLQDAGRVTTPVDGYQLVVVGGAIYSGRWHAGAHRFLKRHRSELAGVPVAVFGMGPRRDEAESWVRSRAQLDRVVAKRGWLRPIAVTVFGGVDPKPRRDQPPRDLRDWNAIDTWIDELPLPRNG